MKNPPREARRLPIADYLAIFSAKLDGLFMMRSASRIPPFDWVEWAECDWDWPEDDADASPFHWPLTQNPDFSWLAE